MFLVNKYTDWYLSIIEKSKSNIPSIYEKHHIMPKSLGGNNDANNIAFLTPRQHFICHWLLTRMVEGKNKDKMIYAFWMMCRNNGHQKRIISSNQYEIARKNFSKVRKGKTYREIYGEEKAKEIKIKQSSMQKGKKKAYNCYENLKNRKLTTAIWEVIHPCGKKEIVKNMAEFCRKHRLSAGNISKYGSTKGFVATKLSNSRTH